MLGMTSLERTVPNLSAVTVFFQKKSQSTHEKAGYFARRTVVEKEFKASTHVADVFFCYYLTWGS